MKIICECGEVTEFVDGEDGSSFTDGEGWYKTVKGSMEINENYDQVYFRCGECGKEIWIFT